MKKILIFKNVFSTVLHDQIYEAALKSLYSIGWADTAEPEKRTQPCLGSHWSSEDVDRLNLFNEFKKYINETPYKKYATKDNLNFVVMNLTKPCDPNFIHTHPNQFGCVYYVNPTWEKNWAGETLFFDEYNKEAVGVSSFLPGRLIVFDGKTPHSVRPQSTIGPEYRFTIGTFLKKK